MYRTLTAFRTYIEKYALQCHANEFQVKQKQMTILERPKILPINLDSIVLGI